mmetsp:Transcript_5639/g.7729  ORF Transcript_5639/g.7729 Transcript_5639/m.7729 type:complete len:781 (-) Transcript_5639:144-2486(-)|eukprot:CAMPEP_0185733496 /NCGR_PEP_ID=MMETSP1171-20130828/19687_1 /TAXON_ID=374046 /ORGANISM="Helicotheca tamensis, Strain CCMP826" /LENGTH=780 /DNA_ID=CAMNT_0028403247 /DNA_START=1144 /DNA_END=3486 /DNA_ORIENTATION=-
MSLNSKLSRHDSTNSSGPDLKIFVKDVHDKYGRKRAISVKSWSTVKDVKDILQQHLHVPPSAQRLYFGPLMTSGGELPNYRSLQDAGIYVSGKTLLLEIKGAANSEASSISSLRAKAASDVCLSSAVLDVTPKPLRRIVQQARRGFALGLKPDLVLDGSGGTYFLHDARKVRVAVFKPADEEPYAVNNPRGYVPHDLTASKSPLMFGGGGDDLDCDFMSLRRGISPGESCLREVAAFLLDHDGFSGVPLTTLAEARHPAFNTNGSRIKVNEGGAAIGSHSLASKSAEASTEKKVGSIQEFVRAEYSMDDLSPSKLDADEVHKIAILDIRILNADRNSANLLCRRNQEDPDKFELVPIDHGYCLRSVCDVSWFDWCWLDWPQLKQPLSQKSKDYILNLDIEADCRMLQERLNIGTEALDYFRSSSKLLQAGVKAGLTLYDIAVMCCRNDDAGELPSKLEVLSNMASELASLAVKNGRWHHVAASRAIEEQLVSESICNSFTRSAHPSILMKSASSTNFTSMSSDLSGSFSQNKLPALAQSSGSDSGSDGGVSAADPEECEEWAAAVIADVTFEQGSSSPERRDRSASVASSSTNDDDSMNLLSSPGGFWHTRPGSSVQEETSDEESGTWSPHLTPRPQGELKRSSVSFDVPPPELLLPPPSVEFPPLPFAVSKSEEETSPIARIGHSLLANDSIDSIPPPKQPKSGGKFLTRSQSYSVISVGSAAKSDLSASLHHNRVDRSNSLSSGDGDYRIYFLKFVDLLIVRETSAAKQKAEFFSSTF